LLGGPRGGGVRGGGGGRKYLKTDFVGLYNRFLGGRGGGGRGGGGRGKFEYFLSSSRIFFCIKAAVVVEGK
jgi:hypothetical protein